MNKLTNSSLKLLIIDEDPNRVHILKESLANSFSTSFDPIIARELNQALQFLKTTSFDAILLNPFFSQLDPLKVFMRIRFKAPTVALVLVAEKENNEVLEHALKAGVHHFLHIGPQLKNFLATTLIFSVEKQRQENTLRDDKEKAQRYLDISGVIIIGLDLDQNVSLINKKGCELIGDDEENILGKNWFDLFIPSSHKEVSKKNFEKMAQGYKNFLRKEEGPIISLRNGERLISWTHSILWDSQGKIIGRLSSGEDITDQKKAVEALRTSEEGWRSLVQNISDFVYKIDQDGKILFMNHLAEGFTNDQVIGANVADFVEPQFRPQVQTAIQTAFKSGETATYETEGLGPNQSIRTYMSRVGPIFRDGKVESLAIISTDITNQKKAEESLRESETRFRTLVSNIPGAVYRCSPDPDRYISFISDSIEKITGYSSTEFLGPQRKSFSSVIYPEDKQRIEQAFSSIRGPYTFEYRIQHANQTIRWVLEQGQPVISKDKKVLYLDGVIFDITSQKQTEQELKVSQKMEAIGRLAGGVAHDFNNLLTSILGFCDLIFLNPQLPLQVKEDLEEVQKAAKRAAELTYQLLAFSRRQILKPQVINPNNVILGMEKMLRRLIGEDIDLVVRLDPFLGNIKADHGQLEQVIMNLVVNARDAMPEGGKIIIETSNVFFQNENLALKGNQKISPHAMLTVADSGIGMNQETQLRIFEPFFTTKEKGRGTGLGLSTVYGIVNQSGGKIKFNSEVGEGTTFRTYFPITSDAISEESSTRLSTVNLRGQETMLLVEDEERVRRLAKRVLLEQGYNVIEAEDGVTALSICEQYNGFIHLLLTDVVMPRMNGPELVHEIKHLYPNMKTLYMSGYTEDHSILSQVMHKENAFLQKPFSPEVLARKVREILDNKN